MAGLPNVTGPGKTSPLSLLLTGLVTGYLVMNVGTIRCCSYRVFVLVLMIFCLYVLTFNVLTLFLP